MANNTPVVIAGGGWAGLAAAVELADHGVPVLLLESAKQLGGRARRVSLDGPALDNGQHLLIGAYRETLRLLDRMGVPEQEVLSRVPLSLRLRAGKERFSLSAPRLPAPFHLLWALLRAEGLDSGERRAALRCALQLALTRFTIPRDTTVAHLLESRRQPARVVERLWAPLCLASLNVSPDEASAQLFLRVLRDAFSRRRRDSDLLFPRTDLSRLFPQPAHNFLKHHGGEVRLRRRVTALRVKDGRLTGVVANDETVKADHVVLALSAHAAGELLGPLDGELARSLSNLAHTPITTVYLRYGEAIRLEERMVGMIGTLTQWVVDLASCGQPGLMAAVVSGDGEHMEWGRTKIARRVAAEVSHQFGWGEPEAAFVIREKRATFHCGAGVDALRPAPKTSLAGLYLAGDYTATGYPATLEGAVRSGVECARLILADLDSTRLEARHETS